MTPELSKEQSDALHSQGQDRLRVVDPKTNRYYVLVEEEALSQLEQASAHEAIAQGIADLKAGRVTPAEEVHAQLRSDLRKRYGG